MNKKGLTRHQGKQRHCFPNYSIKKPGQHEGQLQSLDSYTVTVQRCPRKFVLVFANYCIQCINTACIHAVCVLYVFCSYYMYTWKFSNHVFKLYKIGRSESNQQATLVTYKTLKSLRSYLASTGNERDKGWLLYVEKLWL